MTDYRKMIQDQTRLNIEKWKLGYERYEKLRKLNAREFSELFTRCVKTGDKFDNEVDKLEGP